MSQDLYSRLLVEAKSERKPNYRHFWIAVLILLPLVGVLLLVTSPPQSEYNPEAPTQALIGCALLLSPLALFLLKFWARMVCRFTPSPIGRFLFGGLTLLMAGSGIGFLVDIYLYFYVMAGQPHIFTNEPLAPGPQRDAWLAQRRPQQTVNIDARQVHVHHH